MSSTSGGGSGGGGQRPLPADAPVWGPIIAAACVVAANALCAAGNERSWAWRKLAPRWLPRLLFISNRAPGVPRDARPRGYWALDLIDPEHQVTSPLLSTPMLAALHTFTVLYWAAYVVIDLLYAYGVLPNNYTDRSGPYGEWMSYFTNWSITLLGAAGIVALANMLRRLKRERTARRLYARFLAAASGATAAGAAAGPPAPGGARGPAGGGGRKAEGGPGAYDDGGAARGDGRAACDQQGAATPAGAEGGGGGAARGGAAPALGWKQHPLTRPREEWDWLSVSHCLVMQTATSAAFCVAVWFWVGLVGVAGEAVDTSDASTLMAHAGNVGIALLQVLLTRLPFVSYHFQLLLLWGTLYLIFLWIFGASSGIWRYGLNIQSGRAAGAVALLPAVCFLTWLAWYGLARGREVALVAEARAARAVRGAAGAARRGSGSCRGRRTCCRRSGVSHRVKTRACVTCERVRQLLTSLSD
ncbi:MAG: hypothetical protein J3K34DRAFT_519450 [Monoraphidium minutum]|nr:MAG: hypothetical protein J3K34DRAFT_519450 [Monoraphidium minutum]